MIHVLVLGFSCFQGMASTMRIRNLLMPLIRDREAGVSNLIYQRDVPAMVDREGEQDGIRYKQIRYSTWNPFSIMRYLREGRRYLRYSFRPEDENWLYNYGGPSVVNIFFIKVARRMGYKIVADVVEDNRHEKSTRFFYTLKIWSSLWLLKRSWRFTDVITGISYPIYERLKELSGDRVPVHYLPISVDTDWISESPPFGSPDKVILFYGGSMTERDGLRFLLEAFETLAAEDPRLELNITGAGTESDVQRLMRNAGQLTYGEKVHVLGYLSPEDYRRYLTRCDIACMTRIDTDFARTGFPFKLGEYLAAGKCILATRVGDVPRYLSHGRNALLVDPGSAGQISKAVEGILSDPSGGRELGREARKTALEHFSSKQVSKTFLSLIKIS